MKTRGIPFNISIMSNASSVTQNMRPITSVDIHDTGTNFHDDGLFSVAAFGRIGSEERSRKFAYVDLNTTILHPLLFQTVSKLKADYKGVMTGRTYAVWDDKEKDFIKSNEIDGETGFSFFMKHFKDIKYKKTESRRRDQKILTVKNFEGKETIRRHLISPAGIRDLVIDKTGKTTEDEVNEIYRKLISISRTVEFTEGNLNNKVYDRARTSLQLASLEIYDHYMSLSKGKRGIWQNKMASRSILNGTRNVITAMNPSSSKFKGPQHINATDNVFGLWQAMRASQEKCVHFLRKNYLDSIIGENGNSAILVDPKTLKASLTDLKPRTADSWGTATGLEKLIFSFGDTYKRHEPIMVDDKYLALIYIKDDKFRLFGDITQLPAELSKDDVRPVTWVEFFYICLYEMFDDVAGSVTRYPITGIDSMVPVKFYVKTTVHGKIMKPMNAGWAVSDGVAVAKEYPDVFKKGAFVDSQQPHPSILGGQGADFDGDTSNGNAYNTKESVAEVDKYLKSKTPFTAQTGGLKHGIITDSIELALNGMMWQEEMAW